MDGRVPDSGNKVQPNTVTGKYTNEIRGYAKQKETVNHQRNEQSASRLLATSPHSMDNFQQNSITDKDAFVTRAPIQRLNRTGSRKKKTTKISSNQTKESENSVRQLRIRSDKFLRDFESAKFNSFFDNITNRDVSRDKNSAEFLVVTEQEELKFRPQRSAFVPPRATYVRHTRSLMTSGASASIRFASQVSVITSHNRRTDKTSGSTSSTLQRSVNRNGRNSSREKKRRTSPEYSRSIRSYPESSHHHVTRRLEQLQHMQERQNWEQRKPLPPEILNQAICQIYGVEASKYADEIFVHTENVPHNSGVQSGDSGRTSRYESPRKRDSMLTQITSDAQKKIEGGVTSLLPLEHLETKRPRSLGIHTTNIISITPNYNYDSRPRDLSTRSLIPRWTALPTYSSANTLRSQSAGVSSSTRKAKTTLLPKHLYTPTTLSQCCPSQDTRVRDHRPGTHSKIPVAIRRSKSSCPINTEQSLHLLSSGDYTRTSLSRYREIENEQRRGGARSLSRLPDRTHNSSELKMAVNKKVGMSDSDLNLRHHLWGSQGQLNPVLSNGSETW